MKRKKPEYAYFSRVFAEKLDAWKKEKDETGIKRTQELFAEAIDVATANSISDWKKGYSYPSPKTMAKICEVLNVSESDFQPKAHGDRYLHDREFITEIGKANVTFAKDNGLDIDFVRSISGLVDFDKLFPKYSPIVPDKSNSPDFPSYTRQNNADSSAIIDEDLQFMQLKRDGKTYTLHKSDLAYLKEVQDQVAEYVEFLFWKRAREMEDEVKAFADDLKTPTVVKVKTLIKPEEVEQYAIDLKSHTTKDKPLRDIEIVTPLEKPLQDKYLEIMEDQNLLKPENEDKLIKAIEKIIDIGPGESIELIDPKVDKAFILKHDRFAKYLDLEPPTIKSATQEDIDRYFIDRYFSGKEGK